MTPKGQLKVLCLKTLVKGAIGSETNDSGFSSVLRVLRKVLDNDGELVQPDATPYVFHNEVVRLNLQFNGQGSLAPGRCKIITQNRVQGKPRIMDSIDGHD